MLAELYFMIACANPVIQDNIVFADSVRVSYIHTRRRNLKQTFKKCAQCRTVYSILKTSENIFSFYISMTTGG